MVRNVLQAVYKEVRGLHQAAYILALFAFGSQVLALIRDRLLAHYFGAGTELDLYYTAFRIPDLLYVIFASTLSVYVLIPFVAERISGTDSSKARELLSQIFSLFLIFYIGLALVIALCAPKIVTLVFPGFASEVETLTLLIRILLLQPLFLGISSLLGVITQFSHRFILYALSPLLYNIGIILGLIFLYPHFGLAGLVLGVVVGAAGHLLIQLPFILKSELAPSLRTRFDFAEIRMVLATSLPRALTLSFHQLLLLVLIGIASIMSAGSVSVFQFAFNLQSVPLAIIGVSYSVAAFPLLAQLHAEEKFTEFKNHIMTTLRHIIFWSVPVIALLIVIRAQFVRVIFGTGAFDWDDTRLTAAILALFSLSLTAQAVHLLLVRGLYASGNTRTPFFMSLTSTVLGIVFSYILYHLLVFSDGLRMFLEQAMRLEGVSGTEVLALPLGYSFAVMFDAVLLMIISRKELFIEARKIGIHLLRACIAGVGAGVASYVTLNVAVTLFDINTLAGVFMQGFSAGIVGLAAAILMYFLVGSPELKEVYRSFHRRIRKSDVMIPQDEDHLAV